MKMNVFSPDISTGFLQIIYLKFLEIILRQALYREKNEDYKEIEGTILQLILEKKYKNDATAIIALVDNLVYIMAMSTTVIYKREE